MANGGLDEHMTVQSWSVAVQSWSGSKVQLSDAAPACIYAIDMTLPPVDYRVCITFKVSITAQN
jgi:hypothetical protein